MKTCPICYSEIETVTLFSSVEETCTCYLQEYKTAVFRTRVSVVSVHGNVMNIFFQLPDHIFFIPITITIDELDKRMG